MFSSAFLGKHELKGVLKYQGKKLDAVLSMSIAFLFNTKIEYKKPTYK